MPMMNVLNGGAHADNQIDVREFMLMPVGTQSFSEGVRWCAEAFHALRHVLAGKEAAHTAVGDEGGYAPPISATRRPSGFCFAAIRRAGIPPGRGFRPCARRGCQRMGGRGTGNIPAKSGARFGAEALVEH